MGLAILLGTQLHILIFYALDLIFFPSYHIILGFVDNIQIVTIVGYSCMTPTN